MGEQGDGRSTLQQVFETVYDNVASYAALHYGKELNQQYGDLSLTKLKTSDFFWSSESTRAKNLAKRPAWKTPSGVFSAPRLDMDRLTFIYSEVSAMPTYRGKHHWGKMKAESKRLKSLVAQQEETQQVYWSLIEDAIPESEDEDAEQERVWTQKSKATNVECEITGHKALVR